MTHNENHEPVRLPRKIPPPGGMPECSGITGTDRHGNLIPCEYTPIAVLNVGWICNNPDCSRRGPWELRDVADWLIAEARHAAND